MTSAEVLHTLTPALTTTFTPPTHCVSPKTFTRDVDVLVNDAEPQYIVRPAYSTCFPSSFWAATPSFTDDDGSAFVYASSFSPGLACPWGYSTVTRQLATEAGTTSVRCCPSGFEHDAWRGECSSTGSVWTWVEPGAPIRPTTSRGEAVLKVSDVALAWEASDKVVGAAIKSSDLGSFAAATTALATPRTVSSSLSSPTPRSRKDVPSSIPTPLEKPHEVQRLAEGTVIGIAIGIPIAVLLALYAVLVYISSKKSRTTGVTAVNASRHAAGTTEIYEAGGTAMPAEADHMNVRAELESDWRGNGMDVHR